MNRDGFSLVELVIVLVIIGTLGAIAMPRLGAATARQQLNAAAERVEADLIRARTRARAASQTVTLTFYITTDRYSQTYVGGKSEIIRLDESPYKVDMIYAKFGTTKMAEFNGYGVPANPGSVVLKLGSEQVTITLDGNGEVRR